MIQHSLDSKGSSSDPGQMWNTRRAAFLKCYMINANINRAILPWAQSIIAGRIQAESRSSRGDPGPQWGLEQSYRAPKPVTARRDVICRAQHHNLVSRMLILRDSRRNLLPAPEMSETLYPLHHTVVTGQIRPPAPTLDHKRKEKLMQSFRSAVVSILLSLLAVGAAAQISSFEHVVLVVQENRTPDNLFYAICTSSPCSTKPNSKQYDIQTTNWLDNDASGGITQPTSVPLTDGYALVHSYHGFNVQCDFNSTTGACQMDGDSSPQCSGCAFHYVDNSTGTVTPYIQLAQQYGWANYMFQTNQGQSFPAHQFLFGATSASSAANDAAGIFVSGNETKDPDGAGGCQSEAGAYVYEVTPPNSEDTTIFPCFEHNTVPDIMPSGITWRYFTTTDEDWNAPVAIDHICQPTEPTGGVCTGSEYVDNVDTNPKDFLTDIGTCDFQNLVWVIPTADNSDHGGKNEGGGPSWVASIVNAIGQSTCKNPDGSSYWDTTAILVTWDDWGGWYDHEPPTILAQPEGDYQYGFRVPFLFISAYTQAGYIDNGRHDFGSMIRFVENNFGVKPGILGFADARASDQLANFYNLKNAPRPFVTIPSRLKAEHFINDMKPPQDPDDY